MGDPARALEILDARPGAPPGFAARPRGSWFGYLCAIQGRQQEARKVLADMERRARSGYVGPQELAIVHLGLGDKEQAFSLLEKAYEERAFEVLGFAGPLADILLDDPRFQDILRRMGLAGQPGYAPRKAAR